MENKKTAVDDSYLRNLEAMVADLKTLIDVAAIISSERDFNSLMTTVMEKAKDVMNAEACSILLYNKAENKLEFEVALCEDKSTTDILKKKITLDIGQGIAGHVARTLEPLIIKDAKKDSRFYTEADKQTGFETRSLMAVPLIGRSGLIGVAEILNPRGKESFVEYDLEIFQALSRQVAVAIENAIFHQESIKQERLKQELEVASNIQKSFLPESPVFARGNIRLSAFTIPARHVGGDLYDFVVPIDGKVGVFIGDISGKGVSAALYMAKVISDFRYLSHLMDSPEIALNRLNEQLAKSPRGMFLTAIYMIADEDTGSLRVSVAGHPPFLWISRDDVMVMQPDAGPPAGIMPFEYLAVDMALSVGDRILMLTDGVFEAKNESGQRIGFDNIVRFVEKHKNESNLTELLVKHVNTYAGNAEQADDLTVVELRVAGKDEK